jgi:hypothetical protein
LDDAQGAPGQPDRVDGGIRSSPIKVRSDPSMATSVPVPMCQAEAGLGEGGGVFDPVADHRDGPAVGLQPLDHVDLVGRRHPGDHLVDADLAGHGAGDGVVVGR